jgi:hypothetical protein
MSLGRARGRGFRLLALVAAVGLSWTVAALVLAGAAGAADAADDGPPITEIVPVRIHGHDSSWPPVLVFAAVVVVGGAIVVALVFIRRVREALRPGGTPSTGD